MFFCFLLGFSPSQTQENKTPEIKILAPASNSTFKWNSLIPYSLHVSDYEDGNSEYDEINANEVLLIVKYLKDSTEIKSHLIHESTLDYQPLVRMAASTCFNCHKAKGTLIGPSFELISKRYQEDSKTIDNLTQKVIKGGTSNWGDEIMPPHPDLSVEQVMEMIAWILKNNSDPSKNYLVGIEGTIQTKKQPLSASGRGILALKASYTDHGTKDHSQNPKQVEKTIFLKSK